MIAKIARWLVCGVIGSSTPLIINYVLTIPKTWSYNPLRVVDHGELCIVVAAMCSVSVGELFGVAGRRETSAIISGGFTLLLLMIATGLYVYIPAVKDLPGDYIGAVSYILFGFSLILSMCCIALAAEK
jgi:hypothetical protein